MPSSQTASLNSTFEALADPTRRAMLEALRHGPLTVTELARPHAMSLNGASKHIKKLESAGLILRTINGREHWCRLNASRLEDASNWLQHYTAFWNDRVDALESYLTSKRKKVEK